MTYFFSLVLFLAGKEGHIETKTWQELHTK